MCACVYLDRETRTQEEPLVLGPHFVPDAGIRIEGVVGEWGAPATFLTEQEQVEKEGTCFVGGRVRSRDLTEITEITIV